jgi:hypothetical protein
MHWQDLKLERTRLEWREPAAAMRAQLREAWRAWRSSPGALRIVLRPLALFYVLFGLALATAWIQDHRAPGGGKWLAFALLPPSLLAAAVTIAFLFAWFLPVSTVKLKDTRIVVVGQHAPRRFFVRDIGGYALQQQEGWRRLLIQSSGTWHALALPGSVDTTALRHWMRDRRIPERDTPAAAIPAPPARGGTT